MRACSLLLSRAPWRGLLQDLQPRTRLTGAVERDDTAAAFTEEHRASCICLEPADTHACSLMERFKSTDNRTAATNMDTLSTAGAVAPDTRATEARWRAACAAQVVDVLHDLLETSHDGEYGLRACAEEVDSAQLKQVFQERASQCTQAVSESGGRIGQYGGKVDDGGSVSGAMHRDWVHMKGEVGVDDPLSMLEQCERGEDAAPGAATKRSCIDLPADARALVQRQLLIFLPPKSNGMKHLEPSTRDVARGHRAEPRHRPGQPCGRQPHGARG